MFTGNKIDSYCVRVCVLTRTHPAGGTRSARTLEFISGEETAIPIRSSHAKNRRRTRAGATAHGPPWPWARTPLGHSRAHKFHSDTDLRHQPSGRSKLFCDYSRSVFQTYLWLPPASVRIKYSLARPSFQCHSPPMQGLCPRRTSRLH